jgi:hypothetical protein
MEKDDNMLHLLDLLNKNVRFREKAFNEVRPFGIFTDNGELSSWDEASRNNLIAGLLHIFYEIGGTEDDQQLDCP